jgi:hypothetical protein
MALKLTHAIRNLLLSNHIRISRTTDKAKVLDFLSSVKPLQTNHDLIRLGGATDGGYLVPNDIEGVDVCFSPGVSQVSAFEEDLTKRGIRCFLADYSVDSPPVANDLFDFEKKYLGPADSGNFMTLESWINIKAPTGSDFILQMDIEGAEYGVLFDTSPGTLRKFRMLVIEFHRLDALCDKMGYELISLEDTRGFRSRSHTSQQLHRARSLSGPGHPPRHGVHVSEKRQNPRRSARDLFSP